MIGFNQRNTGTSASTAQQSQFATVPPVQIPRSSLNRSHTLKTAFNAGYLVPIFVDEALPGDTFNLKTSALVRLTTQQVPFMDNLWLDLFYFAIPYRLVWDNWVYFNGEKPTTGYSTVHLTPQMTETPVAESLSDYLGVPIGNSLTFNSLFHRAYNRVYNEWFRDQDLQDELVVDLDDGPDNPGDYVLKRRNKRHDYFTSCRPFLQKGDPVELPLGTSAPLTITGSGAPTFDGGGKTNQPITTQSGTPNVLQAGGNAGSTQNMTWNTPNLGGTADLTSATAATINEIREAFQIQKLLERDARSGTRYNEVIRAHFGVVHPDMSWRTEYLGGGSTRIQVQAVPNTFTNPGTLGAFALADSQGNGFLKSFTEHCIILGLANVRADLTYQQGLHRMFSRRTRYDFYWPSFAHLGEQTVYNKEIFADGSANDDLAFGYQERWSEYRYKPSIVTGKMRSDAVPTLQYWHLALDFSSLPALNSTFMEDQPPMSRITVATTEPNFRGDFWFQYLCARPMPTRSVPGLVDHF